VSVCVCFCVCVCVYAGGVYNEGRRDVTLLTENGHVYSEVT